MRYQEKKAETRIRGKLSFITILIIANITLFSIIIVYYFYNIVSIDRVGYLPKENDLFATCIQYSDNLGFLAKDTREKCGLILEDFYLEDKCKILENSLKDRCNYYIAMKNFRISQCNLINDEKTKKDCMDRLNILIPEGGIR
ncbi:MAG: hypothetical protein Q8N99_08385 [Nanoarchaeota archaeon]|nr:hypothetical protein [Nanoarchaeota archaeon]